MRRILVLQTLGADTFQWQLCTCLQLCWWLCSPFPPPHTQTSYPWPQHPPCPLSQATTIGEGLPPSIMGSQYRHQHCWASWSTLVDFVLTVTLSMYRRDLTPILPPTQQTPLHATTLHHTLTPYTRHVSELCKTVFPKYSSQRRIRNSLTVEWALPSVNPQPWRFTSNSLGLPHVHSLSVCLFLWVCVVRVCFVSTCLYPYVASAACFVFGSVLTGTFLFLVFLRLQ